MTTPQAPSAADASSTFSTSDHSHRRLNILSNTWIVCSPHRAKRPWQGQTESVTVADKPTYDPQCYLCPRNARTSGISNDDYSDTFVFPNDFSALQVDAPAGAVNDGDLLCAESTRGTCNVVCFSPNHGLTVAEMDDVGIRKVVDEWVRQFEALSKQFRYVQIFENKGAVMGCSNPHPHGQIWATDSIPEEVSKELKAFADWGHAHGGKCVLCEYATLEAARGERVVCSNDHFVAVVPYWAYWPFEVLVVPRRHVARITDLVEAERDSLASLLRRVCTRYDNLFCINFPYSMGIHQSPAPIDGDTREIHLHLHFYPPLLRSASVKKFLVGYEMVADLVRDITAEQAAERLRSLSETHYTRARDHGPAS